MLSTYYRKAVLIPFGVVLAGNFIYMGIASAFSTYKSEWLTTESIFPILMLMALINAVAVGILSSSIFLNRYPLINNKPFLSALAWFFCPVAWITAILIRGRSELFDFSQGVDSSGIFTLINTVPYVVGLVVSFVLYRHKLKSNIAVS